MAKIVVAEILARERALTPRPPLPRAGEGEKPLRAGFFVTPRTLTYRRPSGTLHSEGAAMADVTSALQQLDEVAEELARRGDEKLAEKARAAVAAVRAATEPPELISPDEAAKLLGIRSASTVMRWARERLLEGFSVRGRVKVPRRSVENLLGSKVLAREQEYERELAEILDAFDVGDGPVPESELPHIGRAPLDAAIAGNTREPK